ncbi:hypothetical protein ABB37_08292 [Leptomonas pyrrhocoris]|uniref:Uncharacterized protein n=1 Tax=Leptomonas pyrrhocoris TaxID=157538 RepID=A0A0M9FTP1_LEPPY|nr:hypothetical protein ABB37_08292 [Leptomonas pyrrhocoris]KPA75757.1 hypothetical protein ABB37_08292 [Leptomonas pyrrhocoris]|eukprot:XP_015654196.1 hypothetical protein ABB37_08292 [Leptomonas pyrrhocoris]
MMPTPPPEDGTGVRRFVRACGVTSPPPQLPDAAITTRDGYWHPVYPISANGDGSGLRSHSTDWCVLRPPLPRCSPLDAALGPRERLLRLDAPNVLALTAAPFHTPQPVCTPAAAAAGARPSSHTSPLSLEAQTSGESSLTTEHTATMAPLNSPTDSAVFYTETKAPLESATPVNRSNSTVQWIKDGLDEVPRNGSPTPGLLTRTASFSLPAAPLPLASSLTTIITAPLLPDAVLHRTPERRSPAHVSAEASSRASSASTPRNSTTVASEGDNVCCCILPVLPSPPSDALLPLYGTDARQAAAATSVMEAVQRPNKGRGRRPPGPQCFFLSGAVDGGGRGVHTSTSDVSAPHLPPFPTTRSSAAVLLPSMLSTDPPPASTRASFLRPRVAGSNASNNSSIHEPPRKAVLVNIMTTSTTTTLPAALSSEGTDFILSAVSNPGLSVSHPITNRRASSTGETSGSSLALQPRVLSMRWFRGSETSLDAPSLLSPMDVRLSSDAPSPHKSGSSLHTIEERSAAGLPLELQHLPAMAFAARASSSSRTLGASHAHAEKEQSVTSIVKALSHMEWAAQPQPGLREDTSFYKQSLIDVAHKMANLPSPPLPTAAELLVKEQPVSLKAPQGKSPREDDRNARA